MIIFNYILISNILKIDLLKLKFNVIILILNDIVRLFIILTNF